MSTPHTTPQASPQPDRLEQELSALGRSLASRHESPMPEAIADAVRARTPGVVTFGWSLAAAACVLIAGGVWFLSRNPNPAKSRATNGAPIAQGSTPAPRSAAPPALSITALGNATRGLEGAALLDAIPETIAGPAQASTEAIPRAGDWMGAARGRGVLERD